MLKLGGWPRLTWGRGPRRRSFRSLAAVGGPRGPRLDGRGHDVGLARRVPAPVVSDDRRRPALRPSVPEGAGGHSPRPTPASREGARSVDGVTPRQACPRPDGLGRNLRSKTRWFAGFCNSHQVSHFATFFIDARAEISVAESRSVPIIVGADGLPRAAGGLRSRGKCSLAPSAPGFVDRPRRAGRRSSRGDDAGSRRVPARRRFVDAFAVVLVGVSTMILPQVHLRKPCYDFSFL